MRSGSGWREAGGLSWGAPTSSTELRASSSATTRRWSRTSVGGALRMASEPSPRTLIVILNWKNFEDTLACLASLEQAELPGADILVVDNGSRNGSVEAIRSRFASVPLIENSANLGFAGGNNVGIRYASE